MIDLEKYSCSETWHFNSTSTAFFDLITQKLRQYPQKVSVWCAFWAYGMIGPYFFENSNGKMETETGERYGHMLTKFLLSILDDFQLLNTWFQQDGATTTQSRYNRFCTHDFQVDSFGDIWRKRFMLIIQSPFKNWKTIFVSSFRV